MVGFTVYFFKKLLSFLRDHYVYQSFVLRTDGFFDQAFYNQSIYNATGIAHFVQHSFPDLQGGKRCWMASAQNAKDVELLVGNIFVGKKTLDLFNDPSISEQQVDHRLLLYALKVGLLYF